jgi:Ca2+/Na+ antiporter
VYILYVCSVIFAHANDKEPDHDNRIEIDEETAEAFEREQLLKSAEQQPGKLFATSDVYAQLSPTSETVAAAKHSSRDLVQTPTSTTKFVSFAMANTQLMSPPALAPTNTHGVLNNRRASSPHDSSSDSSITADPSTPLSNVAFEKMNVSDSQSQATSPGGAGIRSDDSNSKYNRLNQWCVSLCVITAWLWGLYEAFTRVFGIVSSFVEFVMGYKVPPLHSSNYAAEVADLQAVIGASTVPPGAGLQLVPQQDEDSPHSEDTDTGDLQSAPSSSDAHKNSTVHSASLLRIAIIMCFCVTYIGVCASCILDICTRLVAIIDIDSSTVGATLLAVGSEVSLSL